MKLCDRPEVALSIVAGYVALPHVWRLLVCQELAALHRPDQTRLDKVRILRRTFSGWKRSRRAGRPDPRRVVSWHRRLHDMEAPIVVF